MAEIVVMKKWRDAHAARLPMRSEKPVPAQLVMFTGVRYERLEDLTHRKMDEISLRFDKH
ncbi:hypothetical protein [Rhizobium sp. FY34]|uniref:hypothetical protein n=1 Tax=Rhizobium sp. FY34 TaxID=2562309 RepID=UPI0010C0CE72|nr:hypothetical protein [Rhizobium sp. FY34]